MNSFFELKGVKNMQPELFWMQYGTEHKTTMKRLREEPWFRNIRFWCWGYWYETREEKYRKFMLRNFRELFKKG